MGVSGGHGAAGPSLLSSILNSVEHGMQRLAKYLKAGV